MSTNCQRTWVIRGVTAGQLRHLEVLSLKKTSLEYLPDCLAGLTSLRKLILSNTTIKALPRWIGRLQNLEVLDLRHTQLPELPDELGRTPVAQLLLNEPGLPYLLSMRARLQFRRWLAVYLAISFETDMPINEVRLTDPRQSTPTGQSRPPLSTPKEPLSSFLMTNWRSFKSQKDPPMLTSMCRRRVLVSAGSLYLILLAYET